MKEELVSGLNEWLLNTKPDDRRYKEMEALRDAVEADEIEELEAVLQIIMDKPRPVAKGFAWDFELNENQSDQIDWILANSPDKWRAVFNYLNSNEVKILYGEIGGPYAPEEE